MVGCISDFTDDVINTDVIEINTEYTKEFIHLAPLNSKVRFTDYFPRESDCFRTRLFSNRMKYNEDLRRFIKRFLIKHINGSLLI